MKPWRTVLICLLLGCATHSEAKRSQAVGQAPGFSLRDTSGQMRSLSDHLGKDVVLLNFWATWCLPCAGEMPHLEQMYQAYRDQGFVILSVAMDGPESVAEVVPFARRYGLSFPVLLDEESRVVALYNPTRAAPFSVLISRSGAVTQTYEGYEPGDEMALRTAIQELLSPP